MIRFSLSACCLTTLLFPLVTITPALGQASSGHSALEGEVIENASRTDPSDIYFKAWMSLRDSDEAQQSKEYKKALSLAEQSHRLSQSITLFHPEWRPELVGRKQKEATSKISILRELTVSVQENQGHALYQSQTGQTPAPSKQPAQISEAHLAAISRLQQQLLEAETKLKGMEHRRDAEVAELQQEITKLTAERDRLSQSTLQQEVRELHNRIDLVEAEKRVLAQQLSQAKVELDEANLRIDELDKKEKKARLVANQLNALRNKERAASADLIAEQRETIEQKNQAAAKFEQLLAAERQRTARLQQLLAEARGEIETLTGERDSLLTERDQLAELLQMNQADRVQKLIEQNMTLARNYREAQETLQTISAANDAKSMEVIAARRDLALAKEQIIHQQTETEASSARRIELEKKLKLAYQDIQARRAEGIDDTVLREENTILKETLERLLAVQDRRRDEAALLLKAAEGKAEQDDPAHMEVIRTWANTEMTLAPEEQRIIDRHRADGGTIRSRLARNTPEEVRISKELLNRNTAALESAMIRSYQKGKINVAQELANQLVEDDPSHIPSMINQGIIHLAKGDSGEALSSFDNAIALENGPLPYAHYLKGVAYHTLDQIENAQLEYELSLKQDGTNSDAYSRLGAIYANQGLPGQAREQFELAFRANPDALEPLSNLTVLHLQLEEKAAALNYYRKYLEAGGTPKPKLDRLLAEANREAQQKAQEEIAPAENKEEQAEGANTPIATLP